MEVQELQYHIESNLPLPEANQKKGNSPSPTNTLSLSLSLIASYKSTSFLSLSYTAATVSALVICDLYILIAIGVISKNL